VIPTQGGGSLAEAAFELMGLVIADKYRLIQDIGAGASDRCTSPSTRRWGSSSR